MRKIKLQQLDELFEICTEIGILAYLQDLVKNDIDEHRFNQNGLDGFGKEALPHLIERQYDAVNKLWTLLDSEDFPK